FPDQLARREVGGELPEYVARLNQQLALHKPPGIEQGRQFHEPEVEPRVRLRRQRLLDGLAATRVGEDVDLVLAGKPGCPVPANTGFRTPVWLASIGKEQDLRHCRPTLSVP